MIKPHTKKVLTMSSLAVAGLGLTVLVGLKTGLADTKTDPRPTAVQARSTTMIGKNRNKVPTALQSCIPLQVPQAMLISAAQKDGQGYYLFTAYDEKGSDMLIALNQQGHCSLLLFQYPGDRVSWSQVTPIEVARSLALGDIRGQAEEHGGNAEYQRFLNAMAESGSSDWRPEELWALKQLGFQVPRNFYPIQTKPIQVTP